MTVTQGDMIGFGAANFIFIYLRKVVIHPSN